MRKILVLGVALLLAGSATAAVTAAPKNGDNQDKVLLCHLTASKTNPFVVQSVNANEVQSHEANGDFVYSGSVDAKGKATDDNWCANNQPGDICPNIDGKQTTVPESLTLTDKGQCLVVAPVVPPAQPPTDSGSSNTTTPTTTTDQITSSTAKSAPAAPVVLPDGEVFTGK